MTPVVLVEPFGASFAALIERLSQEPLLQVVECVSAMDALSVVRRVEFCLVLVHARSANDIAQHLTLLKMLQPQIHRKKVRVLMTATFQSDELLERLTYSGCTEIVPDSTPIKALLFKIERHIKGLPRGSAAEAAPLILTAAPASAGAADALTQILTPEQALEGRAQVSAPDPGALAGVRLAPELGLPVDVWLLAGGGARKTAGRWTIRLKGPKPTQGRWGAVDGKNVWRWTFDDGSFANEKGSWTWRGARPEYREGLWIFTGSDAQLGFVVEEGRRGLGYKLDLNPKGSLLVAKDSAQARAYVNTGQGPSAVASVVYVDPLVIKSDFWLLQRNEPIRLGDRWLVRLVGPSPNAGRWVPQSKVVEDQGAPGSSKVASGASEKWWQWIPFEGQSESLIKEPGSWLFYGFLPQSLDGIWSFVSTQSELGFFLGDQCLGAKISLREADNALLLARDSINATQGLAALEATFDKLQQQSDRIAAEAAAAPREIESVIRVLGPADELEREPLIVQEELPTAPLGEVRRDLELKTNERSTQSDDEVFAPELSPLALAFLASELMGKRGMPAQEMARRYCSFVSASLRGLHAELWVCRAGAQWSCQGVTENTSVRYAEAIRGHQNGWADLEGEVVHVVPIQFGGQTLGALAIGGDARVRKIAPKYAIAAARMMVGLMKHFQENTEKATAAA